MVSFCLVLLLLSILGSRGWSLLCFANQSRNKLFVPTRHIRTLSISPMYPHNIKLLYGDTVLTHYVLIIECQSDMKKKNQFYIPPSPCALNLVMVGRLGAPMTLVAILTGAQSPAGPTITGRYSGLSPDKNHQFAFQVGGWAWGQQPHPVKTTLVTETLTNITHIELAADWSQPSGSMTSHDESLQQ